MKGLRRLPPIHDSRFSIRFWLLTVHCSLFTLAACGNDDTPRVGLECSGCHDTAALTAARGNDTDGPREWLQSASRGLVATDSAYTGETEYTLTWPRRGRHPAFTLDPETCYTCHPVSESGERHSLDAYPPGVTESEGDCASACHLWLPEKIHSEGMGGLAYEGTARPFAMLAEGQTRHADIFREGYAAGKSPRTGVKIRFVAPGCVGCHALNDPRHGAITTCTDCHSFATGNPQEAGGSKGLHEMHLSFIKNGRASAGMSGSTPSDCSFCHRFEEEQILSNAACYNCHLSAHDPATRLWP
ncbi:MAG: hypothetical protein HYY13_03585 [Nitrospirae bacterium]|nr:hypothetical protein [Nitrospirota bacterium]